MSRHEAKIFTMEGRRLPPPKGSLKKRAIYGAHIATAILGVVAMGKSFMDLTQASDVRRINKGVKDGTQDIAAVISFLQDPDSPNIRVGHYYVSKSDPQAAAVLLSAKSADNTWEERQIMEKARLDLEQMEDASQGEDIARLQKAQEELNALGASQKGRDANPLPEGAVGTAILLPEIVALIRWIRRQAPQEISPPSRKASAGKGKSPDGI
jgi:hypothetical protein